MKIVPITVPIMNIANTPLDCGELKPYLSTTTATFGSRPIEFVIPIDSSLNPFPSYNNNYFNYNIFKPINNPNELFNLDKQNLYNSINSSNIFKHSDSTDINKLTKLNTPFIPFGYKRSTSFGSIFDGKIYDNNNTNCDNNK